MATITINIPDEELPRIVTSVKPLLKQGEAINLENPSNMETTNKVKQMFIAYLKNLISNRERQIAINQISIQDISIT